MNFRFPTILFATMLAFGGVASAQLPRDTEVAPGHLPQADVDFILNANSANITQIAMGHAAADKAANPGVHSLGDKISASHRKADEALYLAKSRGRDCVVAAADDQMHKVTGARRSTWALLSGRFKLYS